MQGKCLGRFFSSLDGTLNPSQEFPEQTGYAAKHCTVGGFRRPRYRVDRPAASFQASVSLGILVLCARRLVGVAR